MVKRVLLLITLLVLPLLHTYALVIGTNRNYPPFSSMADQKNHFVGLDIDIMQSICSHIKMPCTFKPILVKEIKKALLNQDIDLAISAIVIPKHPSMGFLYSLPYLQSYAQFIVENTSTIQSLTDIQDHTIGTREEASFSELVHTIYANNIKINEYSGLNELMAALSHKTIDAVVTNAPAVHYWMANSGEKYRLIGNKMPIGNGYGIMAAQGQHDLIQKINQAIQEMMNDGSFATIYSRYFF